MGCCASKRRPPPQEAKPVDAGVAAYDVHFVDEKKEDPDEAADEAAVDVTFPNPSPQGKFEFELIDFQHALFVIDRGLSRWSSLSSTMCEHAPSRPDEPTTR